jgi:hypothetical protein
VHSVVRDMVLTAQDPYILRTHLGTLECRLCLTLHVNEGSYLAHTQGKKHQVNLARRAAKETKEAQLLIAPAATGISAVRKKVFMKIGRPGGFLHRRSIRLTMKVTRLQRFGILQINGSA